MLPLQHGVVRIGHHRACRHEAVVDTLDTLADVVTDFGRRDEHARATFDRGVDKAEEILAELREVVLVIPLEDPKAWPVYGSGRAGHTAGGPQGLAGLRVADQRRVERGPRTRFGQIACCPAHRRRPPDPGAPIRVDLGMDQVACSAQGTWSPVDCRSESGEVAAIHEPWLLTCKKDCKIFACFGDLSGFFTWQGSTRGGVAPRAHRFVAR